MPLPIGDSSLNIRLVETKKDLDDFIRLPWRLYKDDPYWVPPLLSETRKQFSEDRNPFLSKVDAALWVVRRGERAVGRISAQINHAYLAQHNNATGHFGFLEAENESDLFNSLFEAAEDWLRARGMKRVAGPYSFSVNLETGLLVDGFNYPPFFEMGHGLDYYKPAVEALGYIKIKDLLAYRLDLKESLSIFTKRILSRPMRSTSFSIRQFDMRRYDDDFLSIFSIYNDAWSQNWGFVPLDEEECRFIAKESRLAIRPQYIYFAEIDGTPVGIIAGLVNVNEAIADLNGRLLPFGWLKLLWRLKMKKFRTSRTVFLGIRKRYQASVLGVKMMEALLAALIGTGLREGYEMVELSWILEDNTNMRRVLEALPSTPYKTYRIYGREF